MDRKIRSANPADRACSTSRGLEMVSYLASQKAPVAFGGDADFDRDFLYIPALIISSLTILGN